jgi:SAM-dependent methyltransferase
VTRVPSKLRRSLTNVGGPVELWGKDEREREALARALDVAADDDASRAHVHGFHSYPARLHPTTARELVARLSPPGALVLDPFCGSGTVLVEARLAGRCAVGIDANPLAVELAWLKTRGATSNERNDLLAAARAAAGEADERRKRRAGATRRYGPEDVALFEPHVLLELDGLREAVRKIGRDWTRRMLALVFSSILVKVSRQKGDTSRAREARRLASGFTLRLFERKTTELVRRLTEYEALLPEKAPPPAVHLGDARRIEGVQRHSVDLVVTSPPYPGTYDYLAHHAARLRWLELDAKRFAEVELGARRNLEHLPYAAALQRFSADLGASLSSMSRVLAPAGTIVLILADSVVARRPVRADRLVRELAPAAALEVTAVGSQIRPHFHEPSARAFDRTARREHAFVCRHRPS